MRSTARPGVGNPPHLRPPHQRNLPRLYPLSPVPAACIFHGSRPGVNEPTSFMSCHAHPRSAARWTTSRSRRLTACPGLSDDRCRLTDTQATDAMEPPCHAGGDQSANGGRHAVAHHHRHRVATVRLRPEDRVRHDPCRRQAAQASRLGGCQLGRIAKASAPATDPSVGHPLRRLPVIARLRYMRCMRNVVELVATTGRVVAISRVAGI